MASTGVGPEVMRAIVMADLGIERLEDLPMADAKNTNGQNLGDLPKPAENTAIGQAWSSFAREEAAATNNHGLAIIADGNLHRARIQPFLHAIQPQRRPDHQRFGQATDRTRFATQSMTVSRFGGVLPPGANVRTFPSSRAPVGTSGPMISTSRDTPSTEPSHILFECEVSFYGIPQHCDGRLVVEDRKGIVVVIFVMSAATVHAVELQYVYIMRYKDCDIMTEVLRPSSKLTIGLRFRLEPMAVKFFGLVQERFPDHVPQLITLDDGVHQDTPARAGGYISDDIIMDLKGLSLTDTDVARPAATESNVESESLNVDEPQGSVDSLENGNVILDLDAAIEELVLMYRDILKDWRETHDGFDFNGAVKATTEVVMTTGTLDAFPDDQKLEVINGALEILAKEETLLYTVVGRVYSRVELIALKSEATCAGLDFTAAKNHGVYKDQLTGARMHEVNRYHPVVSKQPHQNGHSFAIQHNGRVPTDVGQPVAPRHSVNKGLENSSYNIDKMKIQNAGYFPFVEHMKKVANHFKNKQPRVFPPISADEPQVRVSHPMPVAPVREPHVAVQTHTLVSRPMPMAPVVGEPEVAFIHPMAATPVQEPQMAISNAEDSVGDTSGDNEGSRGLSGPRFVQHQEPQLQPQATEHQSPSINTGVEPSKERKPRGLGASRFATGTNPIKNAGKFVGY